MKISYVTLLSVVVEVSLGTYLAIQQEIPFLWAFFAVYGFGVIRNSLFKAIKTEMYS